MNCLRAAIAAGALALTLVHAGRAAALDLGQALRQVEARNPMLAARTAMAEAERRRARAAGAWPSPMLEAGLLNVPTDGRLDVDPMTMRMLGVAQTVPVFGSTRLAGRAARAGAAAAEASADQARRDALGMAWETYCDAWYASELVALVVRHRDIAARTVEAARARYQSGRGRLDDVLRSQAVQKMFDSDLAMFRAEERMARVMLDALRGQPPDSVRDWLTPPPFTLPPGAAALWLAALDDAHPRLRERDAEVERYRLGAAAMRRRLWPDLELRYAYGWREPLMGGHSQDDMFSASVGIMLPLFGPMRAEAAGMEAMARAGRAERAAAELELRAEVIAAHAAAEAARWRATLLADTVIVIQTSALAASWSAYGAGAADLWRVLEGSHALYEDEVALLRTRKDFAHAAARLVRLTGRTDLLGVTPPPPPPGGER